MVQKLCHYIMMECTWYAQSMQVCQKCVPKEVIPDNIFYIYLTFHRKPISPPSPGTNITALFVGVNPESTRRFDCGCRLCILKLGLQFFIFFLSFLHFVISPLPSLHIPWIPHQPPHDTSLPLGHMRAPGAAQLRLIVEFAQKSDGLERRHQGFLSIRFPAE